MTKILFIAFALVLMAVLVRVFVRSPKLGILALIAAAPLEKLSVHVGLTWKPFLVLTPPIVVALAYRWWKGADPKPKLGAFETALGILLAIDLLSLVVAEAPLRAFRMTIQYGVLFAIVGVLIQTLRTPQDLQQAMRVLIGSGLAVMLYGLVQFIGWPLGVNTHLLLGLTAKNPTIPYMFTIPGAVVIPGAEGSARSIIRLSSTFFDWNIFAGFILLVLCVAGSDLARRIYLALPRRRSVLYVGLALFVLLFSFSRSSWIGACVAAVVLGAAWRPLLRGRKTRLVLAATALLFVLGLATAVGPFGAVRRRMAMMFEGDASIYKHTIYAQAALEMFRRSPALGVGLHNFSNYYTHHFDPNDFGSTAHSAYLSFFAETGLFGAVANGVLILLVLQALWRTLRRHRPEDAPYAWAAGLGAAYVGLLASSFFYLFYNQVYLWVLAGLIVAIDRASDSPAEEGLNPLAAKEASP